MEDTGFVCLPPTTNNVCHGHGVVGPEVVYESLRQQGMIGFSLHEVYIK